LGARSESIANKALKVLSALFNFAISNYEDDVGNSLIQDNPVVRLSQIRAWYPNRQRKTKIAMSELPQWFHAVNKLHDVGANSIAESVKHYLILLLFTGLRRREADSLIWAEYRSKDKKKAKSESILDLSNKTIWIPDPKNSQAHCLPLSNYLVDLLTAHRANTHSKYVFPNAKSDHHIIEPRKIMRQVTEKSGVPFMLHDLRRTFVSIADSLDISAYALKRLLNHKISGSDVTTSYIITDVERLRKPMQQITDYILSVVENCAKRDE